MIDEDQKMLREMSIACHDCPVQSIMTRMRCDFSVREQAEDALDELGRLQTEECLHQDYLISVY